MAILKKGPVKRIHINGALLRKGLKACKPISVRARGKVGRAGELAILDDQGFPIAKLVYRPKRPLSSGAVLWIETNERVQYR